MDKQPFTDEEERHWKRITARTARYLFGPLEDEWKYEELESENVSPENSDNGIVLTIRPVGSGDTGRNL